MPTIYTPPQLEPRRDIGEGDNGNGRRPPIDKRTGGNGEGDGDNWSDQPTGSRGPRERIAVSRIGLAFALAGDMLFFVGIITTFIVTKANFHFDAHDRYVNDWVATAIPRILLFNTAVLLISSVTAEIARRSMFREQDVMDEWIGLGRPTSRRAGIWLSATLALGLLFLAGQTIAWQHLAAQPAFLRARSSTSLFYLITGTHALHLFIGLGGLIAALATLRTSRRFATRQVFVDTTVWYWHAMGALWIPLFILLEFFQ
jgi:cytochrome c oxidase subunit III